MRKVKNNTAALLMFGLCLAMGATACDQNGDVPGLPKNNQAVIIGDSVFALSGEIKEFLAGHAQENYRGYAHNGATMVGGSQDIPGQYNTARSDDSNIRTVIMDGGGNDVLGESVCNPWSSACQTILNGVYNTLGVLLSDMSSHGVQDVVYMGYYHATNSRAGYNTALDIGIADLIDICDDSPVSCVYVELRPTFDPHPEWIKSDGIHPTRAGSEVAAGLVWDTMVANNIEQNQ